MHVFDGSVLYSSRFVLDSSMPEVISRKYWKTSSWIPRRHQHQKQNISHVYLRLCLCCSMSAIENFPFHPPVFQKNIPESFLCNFTNNDFGNHNFLCKIQMKAGSWKFEILLAYFSKNFHFLFNDVLSLIFLTSCTIQAGKQWNIFPISLLRIFPQIIQLT